MRNLIIASLLSASIAFAGAVYAISPPVEPAPAASVVPSYERLFGIIKPDEQGLWRVYVNETHEPRGLDTFVKQTDTYIRVFFAGKFYRKAGTVQITTDDGFGPRISAHANLGLASTTITLFADGEVIDPATIWNYAPQVGNGNLWVDVTMIE